MSEAKSNGKVYFIGAGPGDPGLLTVRGREILERADIVAYSFQDASVRPLLRHANPQAQLVDFELQEDDVLTLRDKIIEGRVAAIILPDWGLLGGYGLDYFSFFRFKQIAYEVIPSLSASIIAPVYAGVFNGIRSPDWSLTIKYVYTDPDYPFLAWADEEAELAHWQRLADSDSGLFLIGDIKGLIEASKLLIKLDKAPKTPTALIENATTFRQKVSTCYLQEVEEYVKKSSFEFNSEAIMVVDEQVAAWERMRWFDLPENRPLLGKRIVVTRAQAQAGTLAAKLTALGADAIEFATLKIAPPLDYAPIDAAIAQLDSYDWVVFTSANGPEYFMARLKEAGKDARAFGKAKICAIGPATAATLERYNLKADLIPEKYVAESILESFNRLGEIAGQRFLLARADVAREALADGLQQMGGDVTEVKIYRQLMPSDNEGPTNVSASEMTEMLKVNEVDAVLFTSSNTVRNFAKRLATLSDQPLSELLAHTTVACIGPITSAAARDEYNLNVAIEAREFTIDGLIDALIEHFGNDTKQN